jgi:hypothetical protein
MKPSLASRELNERVCGIGEGGGASSILYTKVGNGLFNMMSSRRIGRGGMDFVVLLLLVHKCPEYGRGSFHVICSAWNGHSTVYARLSMRTSALLPACCYDTKLESQLILTFPSSIDATQ